MLWEQVSAGTVQCCRTLWDAGFEAYPVGGCVRDLLLGRVPGDWDVATSARPEQVIELFEHVVPTGVKHGTITVVLKDESIEVTTFRGESGYSDGRHPDMVYFDATLKEDLSRRDFTINAMALAPDGKIVDLFGGRADLGNGIIRCVGRPEQRFAEDALRMFRAIRFAAQLGFQLTQETELAIRACAGGAEYIAAERVRVEVEKTLCSDRPACVTHFFSFGLMTRWASGCPMDFYCLSHLPAEPLLRWAGLCARLMEEECIASVEDFLRTLKLDGTTIRGCEAGWTLLRQGLPEDDVGWRRALAAYGTDGCRASAAMAGEKALLQLEAVLSQNPCVCVERLAISGGELAQRGLKGIQIGAAQRFLLEHVLGKPEDNRPEVLASKLEEFLAHL